MSTQKQTTQQETSTETTDWTAYDRALTAAMAAQAARVPGSR